MAMNPRARRGRPDARRDGAGPRPPSSGDPRRPVKSRYRPDRPAAPAPQAETTVPPSGVDAVIDDFTRSWERGERPRAECYLGRLRLEDSVELIYHEYCLAESSDLAPDPADYLRRFPEHAERLGRLFSLHHAVPTRALRDWAEPVDLPQAGDEIGPYRLLRELGRGAFARVFLAEQADLDGRLVVLKVSTRSTAEPQLLARARHPHIVEVLRHAATDDGALHLVCMPFLGGATLGSVLEARRKLGRLARSGLDLLADLDRVSASEYPQAELIGPAREILAGLSYPRALAWIAARLAEALDHACERGVAHGDLKPSNVLMTAEGVPLLLDMNLSTDWRGADPNFGDGPGGDLGGTPAYMAPERLSAIARGGEGAVSGAADGHRADLYALGLVLLEALTGKPPEVPRDRSQDPRGLAAALGRLRRSLPGPLLGRGDGSIPPGLRSILARCLAPDPLERYTRGNELAEDLDLWRSDRPLAFAEEPRRSALGRQARRRRHPLIAAGLTLAVACLVSSFAWALMRGSSRDVALARYSMILNRADSGAFDFRRVGQWRDDEQVDPAELSARQLARYDALNEPDWRDRDDVRSLPDRERGELEAWLLEQALRHAVALRGRPNAPDSWRRGLDLLDRTIAQTSSTTLRAERAALLGLLERPEANPALPPGHSMPSWMERYLAGIAAEPLHAREALAHYLDALRDRPGLFWAHYRASAVACRIGEFEIAAEQLRTCVDRCPENPALRLLLASAIVYRERATPGSHSADTLAQALGQCDRAVGLDPDYARSYRVRAWVRQVVGQADGAKADVDRYAELTTRGGPARAWSLGFHLNFLPGGNDASRPEAVRALARKVVDDDPRDLGTRTSLAAMLAGDKSPGEAVAEFDKVLASDRGHLRARYQRALLIHRTAPRDALVEYAALIEQPRFEELLTEQPTSIRAFHYVATDLMKRGKIAEAMDIARRGLEYVNRSRSLRGPRRLGVAADFSPESETYYLIARIHAAEAAREPARVDQVVDCLARSFAIDPKSRDHRFADDAWFDGLRDEIDRRLGLLALDR